MGNMTIENIGSFMNSGSMDKVVDRSRIESPMSPGGGADAGSKAKPGEFLDMLNQKLETTNEIQLQADRAIKELVAGRNKNIHETMLMLEKADLNFKLMMQVRNKIIDAYREVMRMQV